MTTEQSFDLQGLSAPPMANGELVFDEPWQGRVFGMARSLCQTGLYSWDDFRAQLIRSIERWDSANEDNSTPYAYYDLFLEAFENLLAEKNLLETEIISNEAVKLHARPHGHDH